MDQALERSSVDCDLRSLQLLTNNQQLFEEFDATFDSIYPEDEFWSFSTFSDFSRLKRDEVANKLLPSALKPHWAALQCTGDGNCLFNAASILLCGSEQLSKVLRLRTCLELYKYRSFYAHHPLIHSLHIKCSTSRSGKEYTPDTLFGCLCLTDESFTVLEKEGADAALRSEISATAKVGTYCSLLHIFALSSVLGRPIRSVYPDASYKFYEAYNCTIQPRILKESEVVIMWTHTAGWRDRNTPFKANHFVPLIFEPQNSSYTYDIDLSTKKTPSFVQGTVNQGTVNIIDKFFSTKNEEHIAEKPENMPKRLLTPLHMPADWYRQVGRTCIGNIARNQKREDSTFEASGNKVLRGTVKGMSCIIYFNFI